MTPEAEALGARLLDEGRFAEALAPLREAHERAPRRGSGHRLGFCLLMLGEFAAAERVLGAEVIAWPDLVDAHNALGVALINQSRPEAALAAFREAERLRPGSAEAANNIGNILSDLGRYDEAIPYLQKAIAAQPGLADAHHNLGMVYQSLKRHPEALASLQQALNLAPETSYTLSHLVWSQIATCRWAGLGERIERLRSQVRERGIAQAPFIFMAVSPSPEEQRRCAELHLRDRLPARPAPLWRGTRYAHGKIRLAYLSSDFNEHATAQLAAGLFERHDRARFEVTGISYGRDDGSPMRRRLAAAFDRFVDVRAQGDAAVAALLRERETDIAVDMKGHTTDSRLGILAHRPAPVQAGFLGFPGSTGADFVDYLFADRFVLPAAEQRFYSEKVVYLPDCYQVNDATRRIADQPSRAASGLPVEGFVFCSFNNNYKITPQVFDVWVRLLTQLPGSLLWLLEDNPDASSNLRREAQGRGVDPARLVFAPRVPHAEHLARQGLADLFLDTLPLNAHTTASDALWAGLPLLTCAGSTFGGRVAGSLLHAVGLPELVTHTLQDYEALALKLARESWLLAELKAKLARNRASQPLFDTDRFRRSIELAYGTMWEAAQRGEPPQAFTVDPGSSR